MIFKRKIVNFSFYILQLIFICYAQKGDNFGKEFVVAFMESGPLGWADGYVEFEIATNAPGWVEVVVTPVPSKPGKYNKKTVYVETTKPIKVSFGDIRLEGTSVQENVFHITASDPIMVVASNRPVVGSSEAFLALPVTALGKDYCVVASGDQLSPYMRDDRWQFAVVSLYDNTEIRVHFADRSLGELPVNPTSKIMFREREYRAGEDVYYYLDQYQAIQAQSTYDFSYSCIDADKPIAVFAGNKWATLPTNANRSVSGHLVEQIPPMASWGRTTPLPRLNGFKMISMGYTGENSFVGLSMAENKIRETLTLYGASNSSSSLSWIWKAGPVKHDMQVYESSPAKTSFVQFIRSGYDSYPVMVYMPQVNQFKPDFTFIALKSHDARKPYRSFVTIYVQDYVTDGFYMDNEALNHALQWTEGSIDSSWISATFEVNEGLHRIHHISPLRQFGCIIYGANRDGSYGYPCGLPVFNTLDCKLTVIKPGDAVDNDCDGKADEEIKNGVDDDYDGQIDEDLVDEDRDYLYGLLFNLGEAGGGTTPSTDTGGSWADGPLRMRTWTTWFVFAVVILSISALSAAFLCVCCKEGNLPDWYPKMKARAESTVMAWRSSISQHRSAMSAFSGISGISARSGVSGMSAVSGVSGMSARSGVSGMSAVSGISARSDASKISNVSGVSGISNVSGVSGISGVSEA